MPITEIDPNDPVFQSVRQESQPGKLNLSGKFAMPAFMQKRETAMYRPPVPQPQPVPREVPRPAPMPRPAPQPTPQPVPKPQPLPTMPARKPLSQTVVIKPKKPILPPLPEQYPTEPQEIDFDTSIDELVEDDMPVAAQPRTMSGAAWALPQHRPLHRTTPVPISATELSSQEIYGTGKGFKFPSFKFPSRKPAPVPEPDEYVGEPETGFYTRSVAKRLAFISVGILLIYLGLTTSGSYYQPATHFSGDLATIFYVYQLGTLIAMAGVVLVYNAVRRSG